MARLRTARPAARLRRGRTDWYRIDNKAGKVAQVYIYDEIGYFGTTAADFVDELRKVKAAEIELHLNSPGGDAFDGIAIYQALLDHPAKVTTHVDALAASAASFIACAGERTVIARNATMMIHEAFGFGIGDAADMRDLAERLDKISDNIADIYAQRAGGTVADWREAMRAETWYDADEAVQAGLADEVKARTDRDPDDGDRDADNSFDLSVFTYQGRADAPPPARRPAAAVATRRSPPAAPPAAAGPLTPAVPWDAEIAEMFRAVVAAHAEQAPAPPAPAPVPAPPAGAADPFIDPVWFHNAIREATRASAS